MVQRATIVLKNVTLPGGRVADVSMNKERVIHVGAALPSDTIIDCTGILVLPGATDIHVHMRGGPQSGKEDWRTGSRSALAGGVTLVVDQPNTVPPLTTPELFAGRVRDASFHSACHFAVNSALTADTNLLSMHHAGAMAFGETFFSQSSYGEAVNPATLMHACDRVKSLGGLITIHAETVRSPAGQSLADHDKARPPAGEVAAVRAVRQINRSGCRIHFCHLSTSSAIDSVSPQESVEVTPHHLFLSVDSFPHASDARGKVNPPLRSEKERALLWSRWDRIDIIASDHAPHIMSEKRQPFGEAPSGMPGVETMMPLLVTKVLDRTITVDALIRKTSVNPASLLGIPKPGFDPGDRPDFALYPRTAARIRADDLHSRCGWTPFEGWMGVFPKRVILGGTVVFHDRQFFAGSPLWFAGKGYRCRKDLSRPKS